MYSFTQSMILVFRASVTYQYFSEKGSELLHVTISGSGGAEAA